MNNNLTEIIFLLDRSGSMQSMGNEPVDGYNEFITAQKDPALGDANVTLVLFGSHVEAMYESKPVAEVEPLTYSQYQATGMTALRDAIGQTANKLGARLAALPEADRPGKVIFAVLTDGDDTSSIQFTPKDIETLIKDQTERYSWHFEFMGTTAEALNSQTFAAAKLSGNMARGFANTDAGLRDAYKSYSTTVSLARSSSSTDQFKSSLTSVVDVAN